MFRPFVSYALIAFTLISQVGVPLHLHYCKGMLESVSMFLEQGCSDLFCGDVSRDADVHAACSDKKDKCCDDEVKLLSQHVDSPVPQYGNWTELQPYLLNGYTDILSDIREVPDPSYRLRINTGPPIYILIHSLIFYA